jgi:predicted transcriptional regulator
MPASQVFRSKVHQYAQDNVRAILTRSPLTKDMSYENILVESRENIAVVTLNRPKSLNVLNRALLGELDSAMDAVAADSAVRAVILTGSGEKAFAAGADIQELAQLSAVEASSLLFAVSKSSQRSKISGNQSSLPSTDSPSVAAASWRWRARSALPARRRSWASPKSSWG